MLFDSNGLKWLFQDHPASYVAELRFELFWQLSHSLKLLTLSWNFENIFTQTPKSGYIYKHSLFFFSLNPPTITLFLPIPYKFSEFPLQQLFLPHTSLTKGTMKNIFQKQTSILLGHISYNYSPKQVHHHRRRLLKALTTEEMSGIVCSPFRMSQIWHIHLFIPKRWAGVTLTFPGLAKILTWDLVEKGLLHIINKTNRTKSYIFINF